MVNYRTVSGLWGSKVYIGTTWIVSVGLAGKIKGRCRQNAGVFVARTASPAATRRELETPLPYTPGEGGSASIVRGVKGRQRSSILLNPFAPPAATRKKSETPFPYTPGEGGSTSISRGGKGWQRVTVMINSLAKSGGSCTAYIQVTCTASCRWFGRLFPSKSLP